MTNDDQVLRRRVLQSLGVAGVISITGCTDTLESNDGDETLPDSDGGNIETDTRGSETVPRSSTEDETESESPGTDETKLEPPEITAFDVDIPSERDVLAYELAAEASGEISEVRIETERDTVSIEPDGSVFRDSGNIDAEGGMINDISVTVITAEGGEASQEDEQYARKFAPYDEEIDFEFSPHYLLFWDGGDTKTFEEAGVGTPKHGPYSQTVDDFDQSNRAAFERHFDQMRGHGIDRVQFNFGENDEERNRIRMYLDNVELLREMKIEFSHPIIQAFRRERDIFEDYEVMVEILDENEEVGTIAGRPVVYFWGFSGLYHEDEIYGRITDEYGSLEELVDEIRNALTAGNTDPFLVADIGNFGDAWVDDGYEPDDLYAAITAFDGVSHWGSGLLNEVGKATQEEYLDSMYEFISGTRSFVDEHNLEYIPCILPGFDDRDNEVWGEGRFAKPEPWVLDRMAGWATEYATADLCFVATWNDWAEGTMIEPGTYDGEDYGTAYLEVLNEYVSNGS